MQRELGISMTPMIDVVFLLLVFFVCTASFQIAESVLPSPLASTGSTQVALPQEEQKIELERIIVKMKQQGVLTQLALNGQPCASFERLTELLTALATIDETFPVILDIAGDVPLGSVIDAYDGGRVAGFQQIQFAANK